MRKRARPVVGEVMTNAQLRETWTEAQFQGAVEGLMREFGWHYYHTRFSLGSQGGFPDIVAWHPARGVHIFVELKKQAGKLTPAQAETIHQLTLSGADTYIWRPSDWDTVYTVLAPEGA